MVTPVSRWRRFCLTLAEARRGFLQFLFIALPGGLAVVVVAGSEAWIRVGTWLNVGGPYGPADGMTKQEMAALWWAGMGVVHCLIWWALYDRLYLRTPAEFYKEAKPGPMLALANFIGTGMLAGFVVTLPAGLTVLAVQGLCVKAWWGRLPALAVFLAGLPSLGAGYSLVRRAVWLWRVRADIENTPTAKVRSAALGLVELKGVARTAAGAGDAILSRKGEAYTSEPFYIEDDTGRVRVEPPKGHTRGEDARMVLTRRAHEQGAWVESQLLAGDPVYVLGNLEVVVDAADANAPVQATLQTPGGAPWVGEERARHVVRPLVPPYGGRFLDEDAAGDSPVGKFLGAFAGLGFGHFPDLFLLTDADEADAKRKFFRQGRRTFAWGVVWCASALPLVYWGLCGLISPGSVCLLRAIGVP